MGGLVPVAKVDGDAQPLTRKRYNGLPALAVARLIRARSSHSDQGELMNVTAGHSKRWGYGPDAPVHLVVQVAGRRVLACTGGAVDRPRDVPFDQVRGDLSCAPCRKVWTGVLKVDR